MWPAEEPSGRGASLRHSWLGSSPAPKGGGINESRRCRCWNKDTALIQPIGITAAATYNHGFVLPKGWPGTGLANAMKLLHTGGRRTTQKDLGENLPNLTNKTLKLIIEALREKHKSIEQYFFTGLAKSLMTIDSLILEELIRVCTSRNIPI